MQKGDRVFSEMSGRTGEVTKANTRKVYILWDKDRDFGLPPMEYSPSDIEIMRIVKGKGALA
jgi:hypothetical protein